MVSGHMVEDKDNECLINLLRGSVDSVSWVNAITHPNSGGCGEDGAGKEIDIRDTDSHYVKSWTGGQSHLKRS